MPSGVVENDTIKLAVLKTPDIDTEIIIICSPSRSHFSPGLKLILQTQVTNPEHGRFLSFSKGVYGRSTKAAISLKHVKIEEKLLPSLKNKFFSNKVHLFDRKTDRSTINS